MTVRRMLAVSDVRGDADKLAEALETDRHDAVAVVGDLAGEREDTRRSVREVFKVLGKARLPSFWIPGPDDAPLSNYLRECYNVEIVFPTLHSVHGTFAFTPDYTIVAGMGGEIADDPGTDREEEYALRYPGWEVEYRLKIVRELEEHERVFLFATLPAHKGLKQPGSEVLAELIKTYSPRVVVAAGGPGVRHEFLGTSLVIMPGSLSEGEFATVDVQQQSVDIGKVD
jgi:Icc-related predicted phosphoesterase